MQAVVLAEALVVLEDIAAADRESLTGVTSSTISASSASAGAGPKADSTAAAIAVSGTA